MSARAVAVDVLLVAGSVLALAAGGAWFVTGAGHLARRAGIPGLVVGLTVVAFGTSAPEFATSVAAA
ncbi:MAG: sodium:calcium antiporter, partial [Halobacteriales archaeon]